MRRGYTQETRFFVCSTISTLETQKKLFKNGEN